MLHAIRKKIKQIVKARTYLTPLSKQNIFLVDRLSRLFEKIKDVEGAVVECGVYKGKGLSVLSSLAKIQKKPVYGFDSFKGFAWQGREWFDDTSLEKVRRFMKKNKFNNTELVEGYFKDILPVWKDRIGAIAFLVIDADLYDSYTCCLDNLWGNVARGGIVLFDEYDSSADRKTWWAPKKAIDEFCAKNKVVLQRDEVSGKVYVIK